MGNFCINCGAQLRKEDNFCSNCGTKIDKSDIEQRNQTSKSTPNSIEKEKAKKELKRVVGGGISFNKTFTNELLRNGLDIIGTGKAIRQQVENEIEETQETVEEAPVETPAEEPVETEAPAEESKESDALSLEELERDLFGDALSKEAEAEETKKIDKFYLLIGGLVFSIVVSIVALIAGYDNFIVAVILIALKCVGLASWQVIIYMLVADTTEYGTYKSGTRATGITFSLQTFISKLKNAAVNSFMLLCIAWTGYNAKASVSDREDLESLPCRTGDRICRRDRDPAALLQTERRRRSDHGEVQ